MVHDLNESYANKTNVGTIVEGMPRSRAVVGQ